MTTTSALFVCLTPNFKTPPLSSARHRPIGTVPTPPQTSYALNVLSFHHTFWTQHYLRAWTLFTISKRSTGFKRWQAMKRSVKKRKQGSPKDCQNEITVPDQYKEYKDSLLQLLPEFEDMCDGQLGRIKTAGHHIELTASNIRLAYSTPYGTCATARKFAAKGIQWRISHQAG